MMKNQLEIPHVPILQSDGTYKCSCGANSIPVPSNVIKHPNNLDVSKIKELNDHFLRNEILDLKGNFTQNYMCEETGIVVVGFN